MFAVGILAPLVGMIISLATKSATRWKGTIVAVFYALSLPLAAMVLVAKTDNPFGVCSFIILMPVGMIIALVVLLPRARARKEQRGFEIHPGPGDERT